VRGTFIQSGKYRRRGQEWELVQWEAAPPSRIEVKLPTDITDRISKARNDHLRFGQFVDALQCIRTRIGSGPVERATLQKMCADLRIPGDFDIAQITWRPDYDAFFYRQLCRRARRLYLFRSEYIFDLENVTVVEMPQLGHATYLFTKPENMSQFLAVYASVTKEDIRQNRDNVAERLRFLGRLIHGVNPRAWLKELKERLGEVGDYAEAVDWAAHPKTKGGRLGLPWAQHPEAAIWLSKLPWAGSIPPRSVRELRSKGDFIPITVHCR
jgi:hypothetical protein